MTADPASRWQGAEASRLRSALPAETTVEVYGSSVTGEVDGWSDLRAADLYAAARSELDPSYRPDWSGLRGVLQRGCHPVLPTR